MDINQLKSEVPLPKLVVELGYEQSLVSRSTNCPFHDDGNPSFGIWETDGMWKWKCHSGCGHGDELDFIQKALGIDQTAALTKLRELAGDIPPTLNLDSLVGTSGSQDGIDWDAAVTAFQPAWKDRLAQWRGFSPEFIDWMVGNHLVGVIDGMLAFPISHTPQPNPRQTGRVDGAHLFSRETGWRIRGGKSAPWFIGEHSENLMVFESQWDAFAFMDRMNWHRHLRHNTCIVITRGASNGKRLDGLIPDKTREVFAFTQNDDAGGRWEKDIASVFRKAKRVATPPEFKDLNEWVQHDSGEPRRVLEALESARRILEPNLPGQFDWQNLMDFRAEEDKDCLLGERWLGKSGSCVWIGSSGLGKSVLTIQAAMTWAAGRDFFGVRPHRPLSSLVIEAENDLGDVAETVQGVAQGMAQEGTGVDMRAVRDRVSIVRVVNKCGFEFISLCADLIAEHQPDCLWIDPLLSYLGGDANSQEDVGAFVHGLGELALSTGTLLHIIHHTGKPKTSKDTAGYTTADLAYAGLGSSVLTNWARAIMVLQSVRGEEDVYKLTAAKRGKRANLQGSGEIPGLAIYLEHSTEGLCWMPSSYVPPEKASAAGRPSFRPAMLHQWPKGGLTQREAVELFSSKHFNEIERCPTRGSVKQAILAYIKLGDLIRGKDKKIHHKMHKPAYEEVF